MSSDVAVTVNHLSKVFSLGRSGRTRTLPTIFKEHLQHPIKAMTRREKFLALDDVTFDVAPGEVVGIVGRNGAGKSTLLKILSRITFPTAGYVELHGAVGSLLEVGTGFHPELTGLENVYLNGAILGMTRGEINDRLEAIVDFAEVDKFLDTPVKRYSSGMRVRLAFAVAAHLEPEILIVDEVLSVGDAGFQAKCIDKMRDISSEDGRTVLYVSHNLVSVEHLCPRSLLLESGQVVTDGNTPDVIAQYLRLFPHAEVEASEGVFDLTAVDREGLGLQPVFRRLELRPSRGEPSANVRMGESLRIELAVEGLSEIAGHLFSITIGSDTMQSIVHMSDRMRRLESVHPRCDHETIVIDIPSVLLTPGEYHIDLLVKARERHIDNVRRAAMFTVVPADVHGSAFRYSSLDGVFMLPWDWEVRPSAVVEARGA